MAQTSGLFTTAPLISQSRLQVVVDRDIALLEPNVAPLITLLTHSEKSRKGVGSPKPQWIEDDYVARWASVTEASLAADTTLDLDDGTKVVANDMLYVPAAIGSSAQGEIMRVVSIATNVVTVLRGQCGTSAADIADNAPIRIIGPAFAEGSDRATPKNTTPVTKTQYLQTFKKGFEMSRTAIQSLAYGAPSGEWARGLKKKLSEHKIDMNAAFLFGKASTATDSVTGKPIRTCDGLKSVISSNIYDAGGQWTYTKFLTFAQMAFRFGSFTKILLCAPAVSNAISFFGYGKIHMRPGDNDLGVKITRLDMGYGEWFLVNDKMLEDPAGSTAGFGAWAFSIDPENIGYMYLEGNGDSSDTKLTTANPENLALADYAAAEYKAEVAPKIMQEQTHALAFNGATYA